MEESSGAGPRRRSVVRREAPSSSSSSPSPPLLPSSSPPPPPPPPPATATAAATTGAGAQEGRWSPTHTRSPSNSPSDGVGTGGSSTPLLAGHVHHSTTAAVRRMEQLSRSYLRGTNNATIDFQIGHGVGWRHRTEEFMKHKGCVGWLYRKFFSMQGWLVALIAAVVLGLSASIINIGTEWVTDLKEGVCTNWFYLSRRMCCLEFEVLSECTNWRSWSSIFGVPSYQFKHEIVDYCFYVLFAVFMGWLAAFFVKHLASYAKGSGIAEIKVVLAGTVMKRLLGGWVLMIKSIGLILAVGSGMSLGKEGPFVHVACAIGNVCCRFFKKFRLNEVKKREVISAFAGAGVSVAFGAPVGGVLFSLEEASYFFTRKTMWRSFFAAVMAVLTLQLTNPNDDGKIVMFEVRYRHSWHMFELLIFVCLGALGGIVGALLCKWNYWWAKKRKSWSWWRNSPVLEIVVLAFVTSVLNYLNPYTKGSSTSLLGVLFDKCDDLSDSTTLADLCNEDKVSKTYMLLMLAALLKFVLAIFTYGTRVPAGIFVPSLAIGALIGRTFGILMQMSYLQNMDSFFYSECHETLVCVIPGVYALVTAAAVLAGVTRMTVSLAVIMFEITGGIEYIVPVMFSVLVSKWVADWVEPTSMSELYIRMNDYPYLDPQFTVATNLLAADVMTPMSTLDVLQGVERLGDVEELLHSSIHKGFPVVGPSNEVLGFISRDCIAESLTEHAKSRPSGYLAPPGAQILCMFRPLLPTEEIDEDEHGSPVIRIDCTGFMDECPIIMMEAAPLDRLYDTVTSLGLRYILLVSRGHLSGLITKKDLWRHTSKVVLKGGSEYFDREHLDEIDRRQRRNRGERSAGVGSFSSTAYQTFSRDSPSS